MEAIVKIYMGEKDPALRPLKHSNLLKYTLDKNFRIIIGRRKGKGLISYIFLDMGPHDIYKRLKYLDKRFKNLNPNELKEVPMEEVERIIPEVPEEEYFGVKLFEVDEDVILDKNSFEKFLRNEYDKYLNLTKKQKKIIFRREPGKIVTGKAGTGKTVLILYQALQDIEYIPDIPKILITYSPDVSYIFRKYIRKIFQKAPEMLNVYIYSFDSFVFNYLKKHIMDTVILSDFDDKNKENIRGLLKLESMLDDYESLIFFEDYLQSRSLARIKPEILWSIIRKVIEGTLQEGTLEEKFKHLSISTRSIDFNLVERAYEKYREELRKNGKISVADSFENVIQCLNRVQLKDEKLIVYVDEIQDFSELERGLLFKILKQIAQKSIFITYDMAQKINYTGFNAKLLYKELQKIFPEDKIATFELETIFRCSKEIVELGEAILSWDRKKFLWETGIKPRLLIIPFEELPKLLEKLKKYKSVMFIDFEGKHRKVFDYDNIYFNYYDVKGLESEIVVLINPFTLNEQEYKFREKLYMSITRARRYLFIVSTKSIKDDWMNKIREKVVLFKQEDLFSEIEEILDFQVDDYYTEVLRNDSMANYIISFLSKSSTENEVFLTKNFEVVKDRLTESGGYEYVENILRKSGKKEQLAYFLLNNTNKYEDAIKIFSELQKFEIAGNICVEKLGDYWSAKDFFAKAKNWEKYAEACELNKDYDEAGDVYLEKLKDYPKAKKMFKKAENWEKYAEACELNKDYEEAIQYYFKVENYTAVGDVYLKYLHDYTKAKEMYKKAKNWEKYAEACELLKDYENASYYYLKAKNYHKSHDIFIKSNLFVQINEISSNKFKNFILVSLGFKHYTDDERKIIKAFKTASLKINKNYSFFKYF